MSDPLVWLPFDPADLGEVPTGLRYEQVDPTEHEVPDSVDEVEFYVPPYQLGPRGGEVLEQMSRLRVVQTLTAGVDNLRGAIPDGVTLCNGRGIHDASTAELAVALTLASLRDLPRFVRRQDLREWAPTWRASVADKTVIVIGAGAIGEAIQARLAPFEATVHMVARSAREGVHAIDELPDLLPDADVVILVVPLTDATRGLVDADFLARMKQGALLVNVARGAVVDTDALLDALHAKRVRAALDVFDTEPLPPESRLWDAPGVLITPHVGGLSSAMWPRAHRVVREQLTRFAAGEPLHSQMTGDY